MELAVTVALDLMGGRISRRQAENWLAEDQVARGWPPRTDTALVKELQLRRYAELRAIYKAEYAVQRQEFWNSVGLQSMNQEAAGSTYWGDKESEHAQERESGPSRPQLPVASCQSAPVARGDATVQG